MGILSVTKGEIVADRFSVRFRIAGSGERTVVLVNGQQQTMGSWRSVSDRFTDDLRIITFDFPGAGRSSILSGDPHLTLDEQMYVLEAVIVALGGGAVSLFGASWGGLVSAGVAARSPQLVERLLLASFGLRPTKAIVELVDEGQALLSQGLTEELGRRMVECFGAGLPDNFKMAIADQFREMDETSASVLSHHGAFVKDIVHASDHIDLTQIQAPTRIINGALDTIIDVDDIGLIGEMIPHAKTTLLPDFGHFLHQEVDGESIIDLYGEFLVGEALVSSLSD